MANPSPKTVLLIIVNFCLVGTGASAIYQVRHVGPGYDRLGLVHDLTIFFFFGLVAFALFFAEYRIAQGLSKRELNPSFGYVQSLGCFLLFVFGILAIYYSHWRPSAHYDSAFPDGILRIILIFGHGVFLANIIWSYVHEGSAS